MSKPIVAIIGRPNVGKSTLFNRITGERISIVEDTPGVTRDRIYADAHWLNREFTLIDTGGMEPETTDFIMQEMYKQTEIAIETADIILFIVDVKQGVTDDDMEVANVLRKSNKKILLVVNKVDSFEKSLMDVYEFYSLGLGDPIPISSGQALGIGDMLDEVIELFPDEQKEYEDEEAIKVAIIGKPNVGKSSLLNKILGKERSIVSDVPGVTRDAIDADYEIDGQKYVFIDTAGIRRKSKIKENIERYSIIRAIAAVERADICIIMISAIEGVTEQDVKIAGIAHERGKGSIIAINKWDAIKKDNKTMNQFKRDIDSKFKFMPYALKVFISALTGQRVSTLFETINEINESGLMRISTGLLNEVLAEAVALNDPPNDKGRALKIFYTTQVSVKPPTFILFVNDYKLMHFSYERYLENQFRNAFGFTGVPIRFIIRDRKE